MTTSNWLAPSKLLEVFANEITAIGGQVTDAFQDDHRLFARSVLPKKADVGPGDAIQGGVAIKGDDREISIHPYTFRLVCQNGAIMARAVQSLRIERDELDFADPIETVREAIHACSSREAFKATTAAMRAARDFDIDLALALTSLRTAIPDARRDGILDAIFHQFSKTRDRSRFGLMNAVTATARHARDPDRRWRLEELGGELAFLDPVPSLSPMAIALEEPARV